MADFDHKPDADAPRAPSGSHLDPHGDSAQPRPSPRPEFGIQDIPSGMGQGDRGPSGSHLDNWNESDTVEPVATRPSSPPDLSFPR